MKTRLTLAVLASIAAGLLTGHLSAQEWSRFRGPNGSGVSTEAGFPAILSRDGNAAWRTPVRPGKSSPVLSRRHVFTVAFDEGQFYTQCFDLASGRRLWERAEPRPRRAPAHRFNDAAAATPVTDGENVYVFFKDLGLISYDAAGERRWAVPLGPFSNNMGLAASPILADDLLILQIDQTSGSYLAAFDPATGKEAWKVARAEGDSWATPVHFTPADGTRAILTAGSGQFGAHAAKDGVRLWSQPGLSPALVASPVVVGDTVFVFGYGYEGPGPFGDALAKYDRNSDGMLQAEEFGEDAWLLQISREEGDFKSPVTLQEWNDAYRKITGRLESAVGANSASPVAAGRPHLPGERGRPGDDREGRPRLDGAREQRSRRTRVRDPGAAGRTGLRADGERAVRLREMIRRRPLSACAASRPAADSSSSSSRSPAR
jgi:hypothetical protein